jgi:hypothetical protein
MKQKLSSTTAEGIALVRAIEASRLGTGVAIASARVDKSP